MSEPTEANAATVALQSTVPMSESTENQAMAATSNEDVETDEATEGDESEGAATSAETSADGSPAKKKRRRRRKKKPEGAEGAAVEGATAESAAPTQAQPKQPRADRPKREHPLPFHRYFGDGPSRKSALANGDIVGGRIVKVEHGIAVVDLFGRGIAFALENEPREVPVIHDDAPAAEEPATAETAAEGAEVASEASTVATAAAPEGTSSGTETAESDEAPAHIDEPVHPMLAINDVLRARIISVSESGHIALGNRIVIRAESRALLAKARDEHRRVWGTVYGFNRGGFDVLVEGIRAFCPASGMSLEPIEDARNVLGRRLEFSVQAAKSGHQGIVVSRRSLLEREARKRVREARKHLAPGQNLKGIVSGVRDFGFFVDLGGFEGLVHMSEVSFDRSIRPQDAVRVGDEVEVKVLRLGGEGGNKKDGRIGLSLKALATDPWDTALKGLDEGSARKGKITRTAEFGAFVELVPGVEGLLHITELGRDLKHASERVKEGEEIWVVIERVDGRARRISLSKLNDADAKVLEQGGELTASSGSSAKAARPGGKVKVKVEKIEPHGLFVQIEGVVGKKGRGYIPNAEMGTERGTDHRKKFPVGTEFEAKVIGMERDGGAKLSRKGIFQDEERKAIHDYRKEAAVKGFGTFGDLLRSKLEK